jgi:PAS domain S-box-containing protein
MFAFQITFKNQLIRRVFLPWHSYCSDLDEYVLKSDSLGEEKMRDENTARGCVIRNLQKLNQRVAELETTKAELKQVQELLQRERETFFPILHKAPYGIALIENDGKFIYINPAFTKLTGYTLEDISSGGDWLCVALPFLEYSQEIINSQKKEGIEKSLSIICKNGEVKQIKCKPTLLNDGRIVVLVSEITKWQRFDLSCPA